MYLDVFVKFFGILMDEKICEKLIYVEFFEEVLNIIDEVDDEVIKEEEVEVNENVIVLIDNLN